MEETSEGEERRGMRRGVGMMELCRPCHCLQTCINALLKCLGFEFDPDSTTGRSLDRSDSQEPCRETLIDEGEEEYYEEERRRGPRQRRPTRPPIGTGSGGQTN